MAFVILMLSQLVHADPVDWPSLVQTPNARLPAPNLGIKPLLVAPDGQPIATKAAWEKERQRLENAWRVQLGPSPAKPEQLDIRIEKTEHVDGYTRQLLHFAAEGDDRVRAYLLIPDGIKPGEKRPAVLVFHPTTRDTLNEPVGLAAKTWGALAVNLTKRGYVTLSPECYILKDPVGWAKGQAQALAQRRPGWTGLGKMTFDAGRCVDFLESVPAVDAKRIGCIGFSLGAKEVIYALAFEPRFAAGVANEPGVGLRMSNWFDAWYLTEKMKDKVPALENHQVVALIAPRPFLLLGGDNGSGNKNIADGDASWTMIQAVLPVYELLGAPDRIGFHNHRGGHDFPKAARGLAFRWLDSWLRWTPAADLVFD